MPNDERAHKYIMYVKDSNVARSRFKNVIDALHDLAEKEKSIGVEVIDVSGLTDAQRDRIAADIRAIPPQTRGRVVSGGGMTLALSGKKNLNLDNTPVLIVKDGSDRPIAVFPHALGGKVEAVEHHLDNALQMGVQGALHEKRVPTEELLTDLLQVLPSIIEEGVTVVGREYATPTGTIDLLLLDANRIPIVVEVEVTATEQAIGQVCKLAEGYAETIRLESTEQGRQMNKDVNIRKAIVCVKTKGMIDQACRSADVELYRLRTERVGRS